MPFRPFLTIAASIILIALTISTSVQARTIKISGTWSRAAIADRCAKAGADCFNCEAGARGEFTCINPKKHTQVSCTEKGHCTGIVPRRVVTTSSSLDAILGRARGSTIGR